MANMVNNSLIVKKDIAQKYLVRDYGYTYPNGDTKYVIDFNILCPMPSDLKNSFEEMDWGVENWGTKTGINECCIEAITEKNKLKYDYVLLSFSTAWGSPDKFYDKLASKTGIIVDGERKGRTKTLPDESYFKNRECRMLNEFKTIDELSVAQQLGMKCAMEWGVRENSYCPMNNDEAKKFVHDMSPGELQDEFNFMNSVKAGVNSLMHSLNVKEGDFYTYGGFEKKNVFSNYQVRNSDLAKALKSINKEEAILKAVNAIHEQWITDNPEKFSKNNGKTAYMHMPLEYIGWEETKKDLLFLEPVLEAMNISYDMDRLKEAYKIMQQDKFYMCDFFLNEGKTDPANDKTLMRMIVHDLPKDGRAERFLISEDCYNKLDVAEMISGQIKNFVSESFKSDKETLNDKTIEPNEIERE